MMIKELIPMPNNPDSIPMITDPEGLRALATRVEQATGADREIDRAVARARGWHRVEPRHTRYKHGAWIAPEDFLGVYSGGAPILDSLHGTEMHREVPAFTASLDVAMTLTRGLEQFGGAAAIMKEAWDRLSQQRGDIEQGYSERLARFVTAASLRALATLEEKSK